VLRGNSGTQRAGAVWAVGGSIVLTSSTVYENSSPSGAALYASDDSSIAASNTIIAFNLDGEAAACDGTGTTTLTCSDVFGHTGGDWVGCIAGQEGSNGNVAADPLFCNIGAGDVRLAEMSPCAPAQSACGLIGALDVGCPTAVEPTTWGAVKAAFR
jgi:hypothetical protein